jgi:nucleoside-diphosphate-sugar epimerase
MTNTLLAIGLGYCAADLAQALAARGWQVAGSTRDAGRAADLIGRGITAVVWPGTDIGPALAGATHLLISAAPLPASADAPARDALLAAHGAEIAARQGGPDPMWIGYLSTIGVYGDHQGGWVDEDTPPRASSPRTRARLQAEAQWQALGAHVFRLGGIYGPGRTPFADLRRGTARRIIKPGQVFSRIHRSDITAALLASIARPNPGRIYNLVDDEPCPPQDALGYAAGLIGLPPPPEEPFETAALSPMAREFYAACKRTSNRRLRQELGVDLAYPTYREGLAALALQED